MRIAKALFEALLGALAILASELLVTVIFVVVFVPVLLSGNGSKAVGLQLAGWVTVTSPLYWLLVIATVTGVVWLFRR